MLAVDDKSPGFKVGGSWRFKEQDIESWIEDKKKEGREMNNS
jgi:predicted DNA-binding transcriptional regulator AlpA